MPNIITRRRFIHSSLAVGAAVSIPVLPAWAGTRRRSPNEEIRVAVAGIRSRGGSHINGLHGLDGVRVVALCDVDRNVLASTAKKFEDRGEKVDTATDIRELLDRDDIDVVSIATPNHWHSLMTIWACQAGKDVYVEKPVSHNVWEGRQMVNAARKYGRIVQAGTQSRSSRTGIAEAFKWLHEGHLGKIKLARGFCYKPRQSIGKVETEQLVPDHIDYNMWTGPAPMGPLMRKRLHYDWHWVFDTGNGDLGNQGVHQMDMCRWALGEDSLPPRVGSIGGRFGYDDDGNTPNTQIMYLDYDAAPLIFEVRGLPKNKASQSNNWGGNMDRVRGMSICAIVECEDGYMTVPNYNSASAFNSDGEKIKQWNGADSHFANFIKAVRSRDVNDLNADVHEGHLSAALCHVGNISYLTGVPMPSEPMRNMFSIVKQDADGPVVESVDRLCAHLEANEVDLGRTPVTMGRWLEIDRDTERFMGDEQANTLLTRNYREPFVVPEIEAPAINAGIEPVGDV